MVTRNKSITVEARKEYCGVITISNHPQAAERAYLGLYSLQHRGQESAGIVTADGGKLHQYRKLGLVNEVFSSPTVWHRLPGKMAIGHVRYSTTGGNLAVNIQPLVIRYREGEVAAGHNGNLTNTVQLREDLANGGSIFQSTTDTELFMHLLARSHAPSTVERAIEAFKQVEGAYSLVMMTPHEIIAARDPHGFRPLSLAKLGEGYVVASETCAFDLLGATYLRDVEPGEVLHIEGGNLTSYFPFEPSPTNFCIFEFIYFSRPDSRIFGGVSVDKMRRRMGRRLADEHPVEADIVISIPDSSNTAALGYSEQSGIPYEIGLIRNHYVGRTFIRPTEEERIFGVKIKFNPVRGALEGKRVVVVDDSIVRGNTSKLLVEMLRHAGAKEIHFRVSSPPITDPCYYGIDTPSKDQLIAANYTVPEIESMLQVDSLGYLSIEGLLSTMAGSKHGWCTCCFSGEYPVAVPLDMDKLRLER